MHGGGEERDKVVIVTAGNTNEPGGGAGVRGGVQGSQPEAEAAG